ncbi:MAG: hypothetical protein DCF19_13360 [Pseudanabaena frigida]|uniref:Uncharacterized protein n=1 Tax=Pseudanabaena frigida TaxID=945775 RepID=A0A2W4W9E2_9CYAN|nr:MAG: hypothetical protein DCF19_13360 [Pseudanabaena frigida]
MEASERKVKLAQKLAEFRTRSQLEAAQKLLIELGIPLESCDIFLPKTPDCDRLETWLSKSFPWSFGQINWTQVKGSICLNWHSYDEVDSIFHQLCQSQQLGNSVINAMWFSAHHPVLEMQMELVRASLTKILVEDWDTWVFDPAAGWCIEIYHEGSICYGKPVND